MYTNLAYSTYSQNNISIESSEKLIKMLYEGVLRFTSQAKKAIEDGNIEKRTYWINRTSAIFAELIHSLNYEGGTVAYYLRGLYTQQLRLLTEANLHNDAARLDEVLNVAKELLQAWKEETDEVVD
ncbi:flagellar export chaperone FliS [Sulfurospirillum barnesii]|uniref:Flagellar biosynthetic protein FliS n=1 Tax=Sulfurospirillum barnesii (strain ATCC 700032 / DSM 10660 / SES-3) TaxID=760154 RepID=U3GKF4_SULBS|nr:flagellar export chaperone FliS [Sulfurospirillum barnesii]AFL68409.1 flagellar biosynthetic protein FliS [Sulfurospirillum barnesii SES-3]